MQAEELVTTGARFDLGGGGWRNVDMGSSAIRYAGLGERVSAIVERHVDRDALATPMREVAASGDDRAW